MTFITEGKTNLKYILIIVILAVIVGGGILGYLYWWLPKQEIKPPEVKVPEKLITEINLKTTKLASKPYDKLKDIYSEVVFSPNGREVVYSEKYIENGVHKTAVVINGERKQVYDGIGASVGLYVFSPDSKSLAYKVRENYEEFIVLNGKEGKKYTTGYGYSPIQSGPIFSPNSKRIAYELSVGPVNDVNQFLVVDDKEIGPYESVYFISFSPDSKKIAYLTKENGKNFLVIDEQKKEISDHQIGLFWYTQNDMDWQTLEDMIANSDKSFFAFWPLRDYTAIFGFGFSPDGKHLSYLANIGGQEKKYTRDPSTFSGGEWFIVVDDKEFKLADQNIIIGQDKLGNIFSPDGRYVAYFYKEQEFSIPWIAGIYDVVGQKETYLKNVRTLAFNPRNSNELSYIFFEKKENDDSQGYYYGYNYIVTYRDGKEIKKGEPYKWITTAKNSVAITYSPDGKNLLSIFTSYVNAYKTFVIINGKEGKKYDRIWNPKFSLDNKYVLYGAQDYEGLWWVVEPVE